MEFKQEIKQLQQDYYNIVKKYYRTNKLIIRMIFNNINNELSMVDLTFRTCLLNSYTDKHIERLTDKHIENAIKQLRARALACIYTAYAIEDVITDNLVPSKNFVEFAKELEELTQKLYNIATQSINKSNQLAKQNNYPLLFENSNISMEDIKQANKQKENENKVN